MNDTSNTKFVIAGSSKFSNLFLADKSKSPFQYEVVTNPQSLLSRSVAVVVLDAELVAKHDVSRWRHAAPQAFIIAEEQATDQADYYIPSDVSKKVTPSVVKQACQQWLTQRQTQQMQAALTAEHQQTLQLTNIGIALSAEKNLHRLLAMILEEGSRLACCDAASLYLLDDSDPNQRKLIFKLTHNYSIEFPFEEKAMPLSETSLAGHVVATGQVVILEDAYDLPKGVPYTLNKWFDKMTGYRTMSMLVIPMKNYRGEVIGALQFINRKKQYDVKLSSLEIIKQSVIPFEHKVIGLVRALASQAAVSIENGMLLERINMLFDGFVRASVHAIEQRDPTTSGHSFRVADLTTELAMVLPRSGKEIFKNVKFSEEELREIRFASLLHDFGKVGVREHVLIKAKKLLPHQLELIHHRIALQKERLYRAAAEQELRLLRSANSKDVEQEREQRAQTLREKIERLDWLLKIILESNEPRLLPEESSALLKEVHAYPYQHIDGTDGSLIDQEELLALSVKKGSLTNDERKEIESHVTHTLEFLSLIPWTPELSRIPSIAAAHHEKLDGTGYPAGLDANQIPLPSKLMAVCDIFDALTASDRPYKMAVPLEKALAILETEAKSQLIDADAVSVFIDAKVYNVIAGKNYDKGVSYVHLPKFAHHVCDMDLHEDGGKGH